jgi:hypothetical protein
MAKLLPGSVKHPMGTVDSPGMFIHEPTNSPNRWWISYRIPGTARRYESLKTLDENQAIMSADNV